MRRYSCDRASSLAGADEEEAVGDRFQWVVDLVRDGGGEPSGSRQLLGPAHDLFAALLFGEIDKEDGDLFRRGCDFGRVLGGQRSQSDQHRDLIAGAGAAERLKGPARLSRSGGLQPGEHRRALRAEDAAKADSAAAQLLLAIAQQPLDARVRIANGAIGLSDDEADGHGLDEAQETLLAGAQGLLGIELQTAGAGLAHLALDGREQAREVLFGDVVVGAGAHGLDSGLLADRTGHDDEWHILPHAL